MYNEETLNSYSRKFAELLFSEYPEWKKYVSDDPEDEIEPGYLMIKVPRLGQKCTDILEFLWISTEDDEITVGFDRFHTHFGWKGISEDDAFLAAMDFIINFLEEKYVIAVRMQGDKWINSCYVQPDRELEAQPGQQVYYRSWKNTHDHWGHQ